MKVAFVLVCFFLVVFGKESPLEKLSNQTVEEFKEVALQCQSKTGVPDGLAQRVYDEEFVDNSKAKCFLHCLMAYIGTIDDYGVIDPTIFLEIIERRPEEFIGDEGQRAIEKCLKTKVLDPCDTAYNFMICIQSQNPAFLHIL